MSSPSRVLHVLSSLGHGGAETFTVQLAIWQSINGYEPSIAYINSASSLGIDTQFETSLKNYLRLAGIKVYALDEGNQKGYWRKRLRNLRLVLKHEHPNVLHIHLGRGLMLMLLGGIRIPAIMTIHNVRVGFPPFLFRIFRRLPVRYVAVSSAVKDVFQSYLDSPIEVIFNGLDFSKLEPKHHRNLKESVNVIGVGTARAQKNYSLLIRATRLLLSMGNLDHSWTIRVAGGGPQFDELVDECARVGVSDVLTFLGPRTDVPELLAESDIFVMSSDYEGMPIAMLEAMYCGLAVATTDFAGVNDLVENQVTALISPVGDAQALANNLHAIISNDEFRHRISSAGQLRAQEFSIENSGKNYARAYQRACDQKK